ncbi:MAG: RNA-binding protein [Niastella sp.]|nr:RNA-binding protein [Niastella sp.]
MHLLISNLNKLTTSSHVVTLFLPFGIISSVKILMNLRSGRSEGSAMIEMETMAGRHAIVALNNLHFMNHFIQVEESY